MELRIGIEQLRRNDRLDHLVDDGIAQIAVTDRRRMLRRNDDGRGAHGALALVLDRHLRLAIGTEEVEIVRLAYFRQAARQLVREHDRERHQLRRLAAGEAEHQSLIAGAAGVDALRDVGRLRVDRRDHRARLAVEAVLGAGVADVFDGVADDGGEVDVRLCGDLAGDHRQTGGNERLAGHASDRILGKHRVENGIRNLVGNLVRVPLGDRLRGKESSMD